MSSRNNKMPRNDRGGKRAPKRSQRSGRRSSPASHGGARSRPAAPVPQYTLATLVAELKERAESGEPQDSLIEWLYSLTSGLGIRMRYDEHETESATEAAEVDPPETPVVGKADDESAAIVSPSSALPATSSPDETPDDEVVDGSAGDEVDIGPDNDGFQKVGKKKSAKQQKKRKEARRLPITIERGRMVIHFSDAALQEREPPASGRFDHLAEGETFVGRIILSCDRRNIRVDAPLCAECNGAVIDARTWTHLVVPSRAFTPRPAAKEVDRALAAPGPSGEIDTGHYDIIQVSDGTVVNLYRWTHPAKGPIWCLASSNGYDVSHLKWMGDKTYAELVYELLSAHPRFVEASGISLMHDHLCEGDVRLNFSKLDAARCYTIGFRHANFHPMGADPAGIWNIQSADLATGTPTYLSSSAVGGVATADAGLPHVPRQALYTREDIIRLATAGGRLGVGSDGTGLQMADLDHISRTALEDAKAVIAGEAPTVPPLPATEGVHVCPFNYGFILRSRDPAATGVYSDILCESPLLRRVRQLVYQRPSRQVREELDESSRLEYNALKAYLTATDRDDFLALFPEFKPRFAIYREFVDNVIHLVLHMHRQNAMAPSSRSAEDTQPRTQTKTVARAMLTHILRHEKDFKAFHADARSIVHDFVVRPEYAVLYLRAIGLPPGSSVESE